MAADLTTIIVIVLIILALLLSFSIGGNDETPTPLAAAGVIKFKYVLILGGIGLALGTIFLSEQVAKYVGQDFLGPDIPKYTTYMLLSVLISAIIWLIIGSFAGIPLSSTHSLFGSIFGVIVVYTLMNPGIDPTGAFNGDKVVEVMLTWVISPIVGFIISYILYKIIAKLYLKKLKGLNQIENLEKIFTWALLIAGFGVSLLSGANSAEAVGILFALKGEYPVSGQYFFYKVLLGIFAFLGLYIAGRYVIRNLAAQATDARPSEGFILQTAAFIVLFVVTPMGIPISHSHVIVFAILGLNRAQKKEVDYKGLGKMVIFWVLTLPIAAIIGGLIYLGFYMNGLF
ncbi:hypothetical protein LCGC14_0948140 [marine sediment metagenome]|uniref:Inorganic phosphate transporter n=1 Tax=marine sediment metagenome TaxID=412755 RepID=A0A0F9NMT6_9ZZZZ